MPTLFGWNRRSCKTVKHSVIAATRSDSQRRARQDVLKLKAGMWVFIQARECPYDEWWLGRTIAVADPEFGGKCFRQFTEKETFEDVMFGARDFAITVQWYERNPSDPARLSFAMIDPVFCVVNATELRHWLPFLEVEQIGGPPAAIVRPTRAQPRETPAARAVRAAVIDAEYEPKRTYHVSLDVEQLVVDRCW